MQVRSERTRFVVPDQARRDTTLGVDTNGNAMQSARVAALLVRAQRMREQGKRSPILL